MRKIIIDSGIGLPSEFIEKYDIEIVPVNLFSEKGEDFSEKSFDEILSYIKKGGILKPSGISPARLVEAYKRNKGKKIISIHIGSTISGIVQTAKVCAKKVKEENIYVDVVDTLNAGPAAGIPILKKIDKIVDERCSLQEIEREIQEISHKTEMLLTVKEAGRLMRVRPVEGLKRILKRPGIIAEYIKSGGGKPLISLKLGKFKTVGFIKKGKDEIDEMMEFIMKNYLKKKDRVLAFTFGCERERDEKRIIEFFKENFEGEIYSTPPLPLWVGTVGTEFIGVTFYKENET